MPETDTEPRRSDTVFDFPQLYSKPSAQSLLSTLDHLALRPSSWDTSNDNDGTNISEHGIPAYLTRIISSPLAWIDSHADKEEVWEAASKRLAERSGRTAMPSVSRTFRITIDEDGSEKTVDIKIYEPSLTGDNLGHKTWVASYLLAKRLPELLPRHFPAVRSSSSVACLLDRSKTGMGSGPNPFKSPISSEALPSGATTNPSDLTSLPCPGKPSPIPIHYPKESHHSPYQPYTPSKTDSRPVKILELGAGTGLVGLAASALFSTTYVHLTDLPSIMPNLQYNIHENRDLAFRSNSQVTAGVLDWSHYRLPIECTAGRNQTEEGNEKFDIILAADSLYAPEHPAWLVATICAYLRRDVQRKPRVIAELPLRGLNPPEHDEFRSCMHDGGFSLLEEGTEPGYDDWAESNTAGGRRKEVRCWWSVWRWAEGRG